jgi:uncharacterized damage-inducible protein DinB
MTNPLEANLAELRNTRQKTLRLIAGLNQSQSEFRPGESKWSVGEVLDHLARSDRLYCQKFTQLVALAKAGKQPTLRVSFAEVNTSIGYIPKPLLAALEAPLGVMNSFVPKCFRETFVRYRLVPAQAPTVAEPTRGRPLQELRSELEAAQQAMEALFQNHSDLDYKSMRVIHPLMGDNNVLELLQFIATHERRHQNQILDILKLSTFPGQVPAQMPAAT